MPITCSEYENGKPHEEVECTLVSHNSKDENREGKDPKTGRPIREVYTVHQWIYVCPTCDGEKCISKALKKSADESHPDGNPAH